MINYVLGGLIIGAVILIIKNSFKSVKEGKCPGCGGCKDSSNCSSIKK